MTIKERRKGDMPRMARFIEITISVLAAITSSVAVTAWTLSARLQDFENGIKSNETALVDLNARATQNRTSIQGIESINATQNSQIAVSDARYTDITRRLDSIENKVDRLVDRQR
jgi:hypothetical protein